MADEPKIPEPKPETPVKPSKTMAGLDILSQGVGGFLRGLGVGDGGISNLGAHLSGVGAPKSIDDQARRNPQILAQGEQLDDDVDIQTGEERNVEDAARQAEYNYNNPPEDIVQAIKVLDKGFVTLAKHVNIGFKEIKQRFDIHATAVNNIAQQTKQYRQDIRNIEDRIKVLEAEGRYSKKNSDTELLQRQLADLQRQLKDQNNRPTDSGSSYFIPPFLPTPNKTSRVPPGTYFSELLNSGLVFSPFALRELQKFKSKEELEKLIAQQPNPEKVRAEIEEERKKEQARRDKNPGIMDRYDTIAKDLGGWRGLVFGGLAVGGAYVAKQGQQIGHWLGQGTKTVTTTGISPTTSTTAATASPWSSAMSMAGPMMAFSQLGATTTPYEDKIIEQAKKSSQATKEKYGKNVVSEARKRYQPWWKWRTIEADDPDDEKYVQKYLADLEKAKSEYRQTPQEVNRAGKGDRLPISKGFENRFSEVFNQPSSNITSEQLKNVVFKEQEVNRAGKGDRLPLFGSKTTQQRIDEVFESLTNESTEALKNLVQPQNVNRSRKGDRLPLFGSKTAQERIDAVFEDLKDNTKTIPKTAIPAHPSSSIKGDRLPLFGSKTTQERIDEAFGELQTKPTETWKPATPMTAKERLEWFGPEDAHPESILTQKNIIDVEKRDIKLTATESLTLKATNEISLEGRVLKFKADELNLDIKRLMIGNKQQNIESLGSGSGGSGASKPRLEDTVGPDAGVVTEEDKQGKLQRFWNWLTGKSTPQVGPPASFNDRFNAVYGSGEKTGGLTFRPGVGQGRVGIGAGGYNQVKAKEIYDYLRSKGVDDNKAKGILANIQAESSFNSASYHMDSNGLPSGGLFQHNGQRLNAMIAQLGPDWKNNWKGQVDFALSERESKQYLSQNFNNAQEASSWWTKNWERPANKEYRAMERLGNLKNYQGYENPNYKIPDATVSQNYTGNRVIESQGQVADIRKGAISSDLKNQLDYAATQAGVQVEVVSGGQAQIGSGGPRTGSTRHDDGGAADLKLFRIDEKGRKQYLDQRNPEDREIMKKFTTEAVRAGATGVGAGMGYMGPNTIHIGGGTSASWGGASWIKEAHSQGTLLRNEQPINLAEWKKGQSQIEVAQNKPTIGNVTKVSGMESAYSRNDATKEAQSYGGIVMHVTGKQSIKEQIEFQRKSGYGYHYVIDKDGKVYNLAGEGDRPNQIRSEEFRTSRFDLTNKNTLGIGFITGGGKLTKAQESARDKLLPELYKQYNIPLTTPSGDPNYPVGHGEVQGADPSRNRLGPGGTPEGQEYALPFRQSERWAQIQQYVQSTQVAGNQSLTPTLKGYWETTKGAMSGFLGTAQAAEAPAEQVPLPKERPLFMTPEQRKEWFGDEGEKTSQQRIDETFGELKTKPSETWKPATPMTEKERIAFGLGPSPVEPIPQKSVATSAETTPIKTKNEDVTLQQEKPSETWKKLEPTEDQKKETKEAWDKVDKGEKQVAKAVPHTEKQNPYTAKQGYGPISNVTNHPERAPPSPGSDGYADQKVNPDGGGGICAISIILPFLFSIGILLHNLPFYIPLMLLV